jgi:glutamate/tyrosine decarboxylase-like PLP-dependent enzyme
METTARLREGIAATPGLRIWGDPAMSLLALGSDALDIMAVGDGMDDRGWHLDRQTAPPALHMMVTPNHAKIVDAFLEDLRAAAASTAPSRDVEARYSQ